MAKLSLLQRIAAAEDVEEELVNVPEWGVDILFRGMSLAALQVLRDIDIEAAQAGDIDQMVKLLQATACDPQTKMPIFDSTSGEQILRSKNGEVLLRLIESGALVVLGVDAAETSGKDLSSTEVEAPPTD